MILGYFPLLSLVSCRLRVNNGTDSFLQYPADTEMHARLCHVLVLASTVNAYRICGFVPAEPQREA